MADEKLTPIAYIKFEANGVEADGLFMSCTLPSGSINSEQQSVYDTNGGNLKINSPVHVNWNEIQLVRGIDSKKGCYDWFEKIAEEGPEGNTCTAKLELLSHKQETVMVWSLEEAYISNYTASASQAGGTGVATEQMTIKYTTAKREQ